jgi:hypothetical protein
MVARNYLRGKGLVTLLRGVWVRIYWGEALSVATLWGKGAGVAWGLIGLSGV